MRWRRLAVCAALLPVAGCQPGDPEYPSFRYRLTVEVQTPEGTRSGSSVIEVNTYRQGPLPKGGAIRRASGAAVAVDLGSRGKLFVLLSSRNDYEWAESIMARVAAEQLPYSFKDPDHWIPAPARPVTIPRTLPATLKNSEPMSGYPYMVRFKDAGDWGSMQFVDPDDLAASFGTGVRLLRITAQLTGDPVTRDSVAALPRPYDLLTDKDRADLRDAARNRPIALIRPNYFYRWLKDESR